MNSWKPEDLRVALLAGGASDEREISLASGRGAGNALREAGFSVTEFDPAEKKDLQNLIAGNYDVAFLCMHGKMGEDGTLQGFLEMIGLPYIGSGVWSSALAMDKAKSKLFYENAGIQTPVSVTLYSPDDMSVEDILSTVGESCVVKPATEGSALGVYIVKGADEVKDAIEKAFELDSEVLVETFVKGTELTIAVLGNEQLEALPVIQIVPRNEFYDFESKYAPGGSQHLCPAPLNAEATEKVQEMAKAAHRVLGCSGISRSDFIMDENGEFWILETNTLPGMTETSLLPDAARAAGIEFPELCTRLIELALEK
ncbi:D-alanine--D-alanine ligase [Slackia piriformis]|jgi:D-alanine-D-alanine ligase|nr:D-alanine--D-alanine ligase [Slackia piriformis]